MPEIITPKAIRAWWFSKNGIFKLIKIKPSGVYDIEMSSVQELLELAESYDVKIVLQLGKQYIFKYKDLYYFAKG